MQTECLRPVVGKLISVVSHQLEKRSDFVESWSFHHFVGDSVPAYESRLL
jgi:hypothetical protein